MVFITDEQREALERLLSLGVASPDNRSSRQAADFLLAWHNADENGGWDVTDLWTVDRAAARDMLAVLTMLSKAGNEGKYPTDFGYEGQIEAVWKLWRKGPKMPVAGLVKLRGWFSRTAAEAGVGTAIWLHEDGTQVEITEVATSKSRTGFWQDVEDLGPVVRWIRAGRPRAGELENGFTPGMPGRYLE